MAGSLKIRVPKSGRVRPPRLDNGQLTAIGLEMVEAQKKRWLAGINASGGSAKPLSKRYAFMKARVTRNPHPIRDMRRTGLTVANFQLRKAINGVIRAENSTRLARQHARQAQQAEDMIGFAGSDQLVVFRLAQKHYGEYLRKAWVPVVG